ncbi:MAG: chromate transporter [Muribaculaceae bacterium]|nr:chromate transporter [Muribaculaceae bacterium]MDE6540541.1 chromate transporter [Muribaculaceae bacterium]
MIYLRLVWSYLKIGFFGFGGGYAMLALIENEIVTPGWISEKAFTDIVAVSQMTPGPIGINSATYIGYAAPMSHGYDSPLWGIAGSLLCTIVVVLPSFILVRYASHYIRRHRDSELITGMFAGLRPVVVGLIASAALLLMNESNFGSTDKEIAISVALAAAALAVNLLTKVHPILIIIASGVAGWLIF